MAPAVAADISYLERMVVRPTWKEILLDLIAQNKIDPWNVDLIKLADEFMLRIKEMHSLDLGLQANIILAAAILLKYKSAYLKYFTTQPTAESAEPLLAEGPLPEVDAELALVSRIPPKRQITMDELIAEMERVIKYESAEIKRLPKGAITETVDLVLAGEDIEKIKEQVLLRIRENVDETGFATFSSILREKTRWEVIYSLLSVLHLAKEGLVSIHQDKLFGDILISIIENNGEKERKEDEKIKIKAESIG